MTAPAAGSAPPWLEAIAGLAAISLLALATARETIQLLRARSSRRWPVVPGRIVRSALARGALGNRSGAAPDIEYEFEVDGARFSGSRISFHEVHATAYSLGMVDRYPEGKAVNVCHHPTKPGLAVLEPGASWINYFLVGTLVPCSLAPIVFAAFGLAELLG